MAPANRKITLSLSRDIPFNKLVLSQSNVRRIKAGLSIEELAEDIAHRTLLQSLNVRPVLDADGAETGMYEVPAGGRRFRALELLVMQKRLAKTVPIPCIVREGGIAAEDSLAENVQRVALHPLDQFRAFRDLLDKGIGEEEIAARFFITPAVVKQRLRLAAVSEKLLDVYAEDGMTLEQLMAFTVVTDHARQEQVWDAVAQSYNNEPYHIRRQLTEGAVRASDRRAQFIGIDTYEATGGIVLRDLFESDDGGWLQDPILLDRLVTEKLQSEAQNLTAEGWKWIAVAIDLPYGHANGLRRLTGETTTLTEEEQAAYQALKDESQRLEEQFSEAEELPDEIDQRLGEIETAIAAFENRPVIYLSDDIARGGVFVSLDRDGDLCVDRGYVRPEDEAPKQSVAGASADLDSDETRGGRPGGSAQRGVITLGEVSSESEIEGDEEGVLKPISERLVMELTAHRTLALRDALANDPDTAFSTVLHALCLTAFYHVASDTCLEIVAKSSGFRVQAPGLADCASAKAIDERHAQWQKQLPEAAAGLWEALVAFDTDSRTAIFAHCASLTINAVHEQWNRNPQRLAHADTLARALNLDLAAAGWRPTVDNYLGRIPKARILEAVREAKGEQSAQLLDHLRKDEMAKEAERLLDGTGWLPELLRLPELDASGSEQETEALPAFLAEDGPESGLDEAQSQTRAAE